jgi:hypothetical protein
LLILFIVNGKAILMPILDDGGEYTQDKGKRGITHQAIQVKPLQLKILFFSKILSWGSL